MTNIHELPQATLTDVPTVLRSIANAIEAGDYGKVTMSTIVIECSMVPNVEVFGAGGSTDRYRAIALLNMGLQKLLS